MLTWLTASDEIRVLAFLSVLNMVLNITRQINKLMCLRLAYCLSVLYMDWKQNSRIEMK